MSWMAPTNAAAVRLDAMIEQANDFLWRKATAPDFHRKKEIQREHRKRCDAWLLRLGVGSEWVIYRMFDAKGALLYIGVAANVVMRLRQHYREQRWIEEVVRVQVSEPFTVREHALIAESLAIERERPRYNKRR